ncbi:hypothetical protein B0H67DRAFT_667139, partial [Lasiosphaeris hirsuta]
TDRWNNILTDCSQALGGLQAALSAETAAQDCRRLIQAIEDVLKTLKVQKRSSITASAKSYLQANRQRRALETLETRLQRTMENLRTSLAIATKIELTNMRQQLNLADEKQAAIAQKLDTVGSAIEKTSDLLSVIKEASTLSEESWMALGQGIILRGLRRNSLVMNSRFEMIRDPAATTFAWILDKPDALLTKHPGLKMNFTDWLKSGSGVFHVVGKPGSGKSTLIKFLSTHEKTLSCLREWASRDHKELIVSTFFFWKLGSEEQKTMRGLLRGLLYHMIEASPDVAQLVFPQHWANLRIRRSSMNALTAAPEFSDEEVKAAFNNLLGSDTTFARYKLCLFMDGLDEFDEPETSTSSFCCQLNEWAHRQFDVKLCVSSREYPTIIDAFRDAQRFTLQKVTVSDIARLVDDTLTRNQHFQDLELREKPSVRGQSFQYSIVRKAEGVFLWVVLLLKWIEEDLATGSTSFDALQHIVDTAPKN